MSQIQLSVDFFTSVRLLAWLRRHLHLEVMVGQGLKLGLRCI